MTPSDIRTRLSLDLEVANSRYIEAIKIYKDTESMTDSEHSDRMGSMECWSNIIKRRQLDIDIYKYLLNKFEEREIT